MGRFFRCMWLFMTGRFREMAKVWAADPTVMEETYNRAIDKMQGGRNRAINATARMVTQEETMTQKLKEAYALREKLQKQQQGCGIKAKSIADKLVAAGKSQDDIKKDAEFVKCQTDYRDKGTRLAQVDTDIKTDEETLKNWQTQSAAMLTKQQQSQRSVEDLKRERDKAVADTVMAKEMEVINSEAAGLDTNVDQDLKAARDAHQQAVARQKVISKLAGADANVSDDEYAKLAEGSKGEAEFDSLVFGSAQQHLEDKEPSTVPES